MPDSSNNPEAIRSSLDAFAAERKEAFSSFETAYLKFRAEAAEHLAAHERLIGELERYKKLVLWVLGFFGIASFGGIISLAVALSLWLDSRLDGKVSARIKKWNDLEVGSGLVVEGRWLDAEEFLMKAYRQYVGPQGDQSDPQYRSLLFNNLLHAFASINVPAPDGQHWLGEDDWNELEAKGSVFRGEVQNRNPGSNPGRDETYYNELFLCTLKYYRESDVLDCIRNYLKGAEDQAASPLSRAPHEFEFAMAAVATGQTDEAVKHLRQASDIDQSDYDFEDAAVKLTSYQNDPEFKMWCICAARLHRDFNKNLQDLVKKINEELERPTDSGVRASP